MNSIFKLLGVVTLIAAPAMGFAHGAKGVNGEVGFSAAPEGSVPGPTATAHDQITDVDNAANNANPQSHEATPHSAPGLPDQAGPKPKD